jgi:quercetin dioxygenase-like cupin family protein
MKTYKIFLLGAVTFVGITAFLTPETAFAQQSGISRTNLQRHDISILGYETIQARIDFEANSAFGMHNHPGEEVIYVLEGTFEYQIEGEKPIILKAGDVLFVPAGKNHSARNVGNVKASELATYIVEKNKPLLVMKNK